MENNNKTEGRFGKSEASGAGRAIFILLKERLTDGQSGIRATRDKSSTVQTELFPVFTPEENGRMQAERKREKNLRHTRCFCAAAPQKPVCQKARPALPYLHAPNVLRTVVL